MTAGGTSIYRKYGRVLVRIQEESRHIQGRRHQAAGVVPQVEDDSLATVLCQLAYGNLDVVGQRLAELEGPDVTDGSIVVRMDRRRKDG